MRHIAALTLCLALTAQARADTPTSSFNAQASGTLQPVPRLVREDLQRPAGRAEITITPDTITSGGQHFLSTAQWGFWLWADELHMQFFTADGARHLVRINDDPEGVTVPAGQPFTFTLQWSPAGVGVFVDGSLRAYLEGDFQEPDETLSYGAASDGQRPYNGRIAVDVWSAPSAFDPCQDHPAWGTVQVRTAAGTQQAQLPIDKPTCQTVPDPDAEPKVVVNGIGTAELSWSRPTENEDGSVLLAAEIHGYSIFFGGASRIGRCVDRPTARDDVSCYPNVMGIAGELAEQQVVFSIEEDSTVYFAMATIAHNADGEDLLSRYSTEVARAFVVNIEDVPDQEPPAPPSGINVNVTVTVECTTDEGTAVPCNIEVQ